MAPPDPATFNHAPPSYEAEPPALVASIPSLDRASASSVTASATGHDIHGPHVPHVNDPEASHRLSFDHDHDPYQLAASFKSESDIGHIKSNTARKRIPARFQASRRDRHLRAFYRDQNEKIRNLLKPVEDHEREARQSQGDTNLRYQIAVKGSLFANICLASLQLYAASSSGSLSLITTMADSIFDPFSGLMLMLSHRAVKKVDPLRYPSGRARISTAGNIVFSFIMSSVSLVIIVLSALELAQGSDEETNDFHVPSVIAVAIAFATKFGLFCYCWSIKHLYMQVEILWRDHRNDLPVNAFGILTFAAGSKIRWWIDPMGAVILSVAIATLWLKTAKEEFQLLIGVSAEPQFLQLVTYIAATHSDDIRQIDTVRAYHSGPRYIVEIDVVMDRHERLDVVHDVAEDLQIKIEKLPDVERAFVHIDYETSHKPEHDLKKDL